MSLWTEANDESSLFLFFGTWKDVSQSQKKGNANKAHVKAGK